MSNEELIRYHATELQKAVARLEQEQDELRSKSNDKWLSSKTAAAKYLDISRTTFYERYLGNGLNWVEGKGVKTSHLDNFEPHF